MGGTYDLGIDVGTTLTTAAARRADGTLEIVGLGARSDRVPTVVYMDEEGKILVGEPAARLAAADPVGATWDLKRRLGDPAPLIVRSSPFSAEALLARVVAHVVQRAGEREGGPPRHTVVAHPTTWDPFRADLAAQALRQAGLERFSLVTEAQAAAEAHALRHPVPLGGTIAVFAPGGSRVEVAVVRGGSNGFDVVSAAAVEGFGGDTADAAVMDIVRRELGADWPADPDDPATAGAMAQLAKSCTEAKELLSLDDTAAVPVLLPGVQRTVTVRRSDLEQAVAPALDRAIGALERVVADAGVDPASLAAVLPVGGTTRMPLVVSSLRARFGDKVVTDTDPTGLVARGAALTAGRHTSSAPSGLRRVEAAEPPVAAAAAAPPTEAAGDGGSSGSILETEPARDGPGSGRGRRIALVAAVAAAAVGVGVLAVVLTSDDDDGGTRVTSSSLDSLPDTTVDAGEGVAAASPEGMVEIPAGTYTIGVDNPEASSAETLTRTVDVEAFYIDEAEVTNEQYRRFVEQVGAPAPATWGVSGFPAGEEQFPVSGVTFDWAAAYCQSLGKRLPTEIEWEVAARGAEARVYPWGDEAAAVELPQSGTYAVRSVPGNVSPFGVYDMTGNVWEWVTDSYDERVTEDQRVLRGGQNGYLRENVTRLPVDPLRSNAVGIAGFRCAASEVDPGRAPLEFGDFDVPETPPAPEPEPLPEGVLVSDKFQDPTSGWIEETTDQYRFGYHPNEYFHLESRVGGQEVLALGPASWEPGRPTTLRTVAFVEPNLTGPEGDFRYGLAFNFDADGEGLIFIVNPRANRWLVCQRAADGSYTVLVDGTRAFRDVIELEVDLLGFDRFEFRIDGNVVHTRNISGLEGTDTGFVLLSSPDSTKVHIHFEEFEMLDIE